MALLGVTSMGGGYRRVEFFVSEPELHVQGYLGYPHSGPFLGPFAAWG